MQDGAPPYYGIFVQDLLGTLPGGWSGGRGRTEWAAHSPDVTPVDFFWSVAKI